MASRSIIVAFTEAISEWIAKGEVVDRYFNPGDLFDDVHVLLTNNDTPDPEAVQRMSGRATPHVHNLPLPNKAMVKSLGWRPRLLRGWSQGAVEIARQVQPSLVRCHGAWHNALAAAEIKRELGIPYVVSLHINPDEDVRGRRQERIDWLQWRAITGIERYTLRRADLVLPVYRPIVPYLEQLRVPHYEVAYNMLNTTALREKSSYELNRPPEVVSVGRQFEAKNPENLIRAIAGIDGARLTLIGSGPLHDQLREVAQETGARDRIDFLSALSNDEVCARLAAADVFATHSEYWELSKTVIEAMLTGLPVVINRRTGPLVPELTDDLCVYVDDDPSAWRMELEALLADDERRAALGRRAREHAQANWAPEVTEKRFVELYERVMRGARATHA